VHDRAQVKNGGTKKDSTESGDPSNGYGTTARTVLTMLKSNQPDHKLQGGGVGSAGLNCLTRSTVFRKITKWAFAQCDHDDTGQLGKGELYEGILLVHLQLAKYAGAAACYPPTRTVIDRLFDAADDNKSGSIDEHEFDQIVLISCGQIASRILVYYAIIILLVPYVAAYVIRGLLDIDVWMGWGNVEWLEWILTFGQLGEETVSLVVFFLLVPMMFDWIDHYSKRAAELAEAPNQASAVPKVRMKKAS
jgi:hypothetical protein